MDTNRIYGNIILRNAFQAEDKFVAELDVIEFEKMFGVQILYLDMNIKENKDKEPIDLMVSLNVDQGDIVFDSENQTLLINGEYNFIDGLKKFEKLEVHPNSKVQFMITLLSKEEVRSYLEQTNTIRKTNS